MYPQHSAWDKDKKKTVKILEMLIIIKSKLKYQLTG